VTVDDFWKLIAQVDHRLLHRGDGYDEAALRPLIDALAVLEKPELQSFQDHLAQALYGLDGRAYFDASADAAGTDDSFLHVRCFVVAMGQETYQRTLRDPRLMPKTIGQWCEPLLYAAQSAWRQETGKDVDFDTKVSFESGSNGALWSAEKDNDWRQDARDDIKRWRRAAREMRARARGDAHQKDWLQLAENNERMAEELEKKLRGEPE
jgi:hypothetical protein